MPLATVVTAVRNGEQYLAQTIASVQAQTFRNWEYLIVDDASQDGTVRIVEEAMQMDPRVRLIRREVSGGPYAAANEGIRHASGRYIFRLDGDDIAAPHRVAHQLAFMAHHPHLRACASGGRLVSRPGGVVGQVRMLPTTPGCVRWHLFVRRNLRHSSACVERDALEAIGGYRELSAAQDLRLWCDLSRRQWVGATPEVLVYSRRHPESLTRNLRGPQRELAIDVLADHVEAVLGKPWSRADVTTLWELQRTSTVTPFADGLRVIRRWERAWRRDVTLSAEDRAHLKALKRSLVIRLLLKRRAVSEAFSRTMAFAKR